MAARLSRLLTATTVFLLVALLLIMIVDRLTSANLSRFSIRPITNVRLHPGKLND